MESPLIDLNLDDTALSGMVKRRAQTAEAAWERKYGLKEVRKANKELYTGEYLTKALRHVTNQDSPYFDPRLFIAVRVLTPFLAGKLSQPEVTPANATDIARHFAQDFERILVKVAEDAFAKAKLRLAVQDLLKGQRKGVLKWVYEPDEDELCLEYCAPETIIIDAGTKLYEEPRFIQHKEPRTLEHILEDFPDKQNKIYETLRIVKGTNSQLEKEYDVSENWLFVKDADNQKRLGVVHMLGDIVLSKMVDPNFNYSGQNFIKRPMMPFVILNFLNDGSGYEDETSLIEQAQFSQKAYDTIGQTIKDHTKNASGVPVFTKGAMEATDAAKVRFDNKKRIILDTDDVNKAFTTWQAPSLQSIVSEEKLDNRNNIDNIFGTPSIFRGEKTDANTLGQDVILRDQAEGRQEDPIDAIAAGMRRFYQLEAQFIHRYFDEEHYYNFSGRDGQFEHLIISSAKLAKNAGIVIDVEPGSNLPTDRTQKREVTLKLLEMDKYPVLQAYRDLGVDNPEETYKMWLNQQLDPQAAIREAAKDLFDRQAEEDLTVVMGGKVPKEREDISPEYVAYLNNWLLTDKFRLQTPATQAAVSEFIQAVIAKATLKVAKMQSMEIPPPQPDPNAPVDPNQPPDPNQPVPTPQAPTQEPMQPPVPEPLPTVVQ